MTDNIADQLRSQARLQRTAAQAVRRPDRLRYPKDEAMTHDDDISVPNKLAVFAIPRDDWQSITIPDGYASDADGAAKVIRREIDCTDFRPEHVWFDREMSAYFADGPSAEYKSPPRYSPNEAEEMAIVARTLSCAKSRDDAMMIAANTGVDARLARQWINERFPRG